MSPYTWHHRKEWNKCSYNISMSLKLSTKLNSWKILLVSVTHCCLQTSRCSCCGRNTLFGIGALKIPRLKLWVSWHDGSRWFHPPSQPMSFFAYQMLSATAARTCSWWCLGAASWTCRASCAFQTSAPTSYAVMWWLKIHQDSSEAPSWLGELLGVSDTRVLLHFKKRSCLEGDEACFATACYVEY